VALARVDDDVATAILHAHGLTGEKARSEVVRSVGVGDAEGPDGMLAFTSAARDALDATLHESLGLGHARVEPAHLLLGILRQRDAVARRILAAAGAHPPEVRAEVVRRLGVEPAASADSDCELLVEILERGGLVAVWLRERGVDEDAVRRMLGEP
jgi:ATP-dependent Clp protease ATP-binding subunit ClpA